jgi:hypothetical protein
MLGLEDLVLEFQRVGDPVDLGFRRSAGPQIDQSADPKIRKRDPQITKSPKRQISDMAPTNFAERIAEGVGS